MRRKLEVASTFNQSRMLLKQVNQDSVPGFDFFGQFSIFVVQALDVGSLGESAFAVSERNVSGIEQ